jgi:hypothetical protein
MFYNYLLGFGDSWPNGAELAEGQKNYIQLLGDKLNLPWTRWYNFSQPGTSIPHLVLQLQSAIIHAAENRIDLSDSVAVFFLTNPARDLVWSSMDTFQPIHLNPRNPESKTWYKYFNTFQLEQYRVNTTLLSLQQMCQHHEITDYYIWGWETVDLWSEVNQTRFVGGDLTLAEVFLGQRREEILQVSDEVAIAEDRIITYLHDSGNQYVWPNHNHPNQLGHVKIADYLYDFISKDVH